MIGAMLIGYDEQEIRPRVHVQLAGGLEFEEYVAGFFAGELFDGRNAVAEFLEGPERAVTDVDENRKQREAEFFLFPAKIVCPFGSYLTLTVGDENDVDCVLHTGSVGGRPGVARVTVGWSCVRD